MPAYEQQPSTMDPHAFARVVRDSRPEELERLMGGPERAPLLERIFGDMPDVFRPAKAGQLRATIHWSVGDRPGGGNDLFELVIADGACTLSPKPGTEPTVTMTIGGVDFIRMVTGNANPILLYLRGRLRSKGDRSLANRIPSLFDPPRP